MKKLIAVLVALFLFVLPVFASDFSLPDGFEWLCEEHHVIKHGDDICPVCYPIYNARSVVSTSWVPSSIQYSVQDDLTYPASYATSSYNASTGAHTLTTTADVSSSNALACFAISQTLFWSSLSDYEAYPYVIFECDISSSSDDIKMHSNDLSRLQFGTFYPFRSGSGPVAGDQHALLWDDNGDGSYHISCMFNGTSQYNKVVALALRGTFPTGTTITFSNFSLNVSNDLSDAPVPLPPEPLLPPTDSDQWQDEQFAGAVNPDLQGKLDNVNTQISDIHEIEDGVIDQFHEHYSDVSPDKIVFDNSLITAMRWIGTQFEGAYNAVGDVTGLIPVITLPMFVGLCLLMLGRGGQAMTATRLHIQSRRRDEDA